MRVCARAPIAQLLNPKIYSPGNFEGTRTKDGCRFSRTESFGITMPVIGPIMNFLLFKIIFRKKCNWQLIRDDMILDNKYLTEILTEGKYPERIPVERLKEGLK